MATSDRMDMQPENKNTFLNNKYSKIKTHLQLSRYRPKEKNKDKKNSYNRKSGFRFLDENDLR